MVAVAQEEEGVEARALEVREEAAAVRALRVVRGRRPRIRETRVPPEPAPIPAEPTQTPIRVATSTIPITKTGWIRTADRAPVERMVHVPECRFCSTRAYSWLFGAKIAVAMFSGHGAMIHGQFYLAPH